MSDGEIMVSEPESPQEERSQEDRLGSLLESNVELSCADFDLLRSSLHQHEAEESRLQEREAELLHELHQTRQRRKHVKAAMDAQRRALSTAPIRQLPTELLLDIFERVLNLCKTDPYTDPQNAHDGILAMSRVCRRWRSLALTQPSLWSQINVESWQTLGAEDVARLRTILSHSKDYPLTIVYDESSDDKDSNMWSLLLAHMSHWESLRVLIHTCGFMTWHINRSSAPLPLLKSLDLRIYKDGAKWERTPCTLDLFAAASRLATVTFDNFRDPSPAKLQWEGITSLCIGDTRRMEYDAQLSLIQKAANVRRLKCTQFLRASPQGITNVSTVRQWTGWSNQLVFFTFPSLVSLKVKLAPESNVRSLASFLDRSHCTLTSLHVDNFDLSEELVETFKTLPQLRRLIIGYACTSPRLLESFFTSLIPTGDDTLLPSLEVLVMYDSGSIRGPTCSSPAFIHMVQSRWDTTSVAQLRRVAFRLNHPWHKEEYRLTEEDLRMVERWRAEGLDITVILPSATRDPEDWDEHVDSDESDNGF